MGMKNILRRVVSGIAVTALALAFPVSSLASGSLGVNAGSAGGVAAGNDPNYAAKFHAYPQNQGIRMSLVDKDGDRISNSVDIVNYVPSSLLNGYHFGSDVTANRYSGSEAEISKYTAKFINWIGWKKVAEGFGTKRENFEYSNGIKTEKYTENTWSHGVDAGIAPHRGKYGTINTIMIPRGAFNQLLFATIDADAIKDGKIADWDALNLLTDRMVIPSLLGSDGNFSPGGTLLKAAFESQIKFRDGSVGERNIASYILNMWVTVYDNRGNGTRGGRKLFEILDGVQGKEKLGTTKEDGTKYDLSDLLSEYKYRMIVEPIYWYVPEIVTTNPERIAQKGTLHENYINGVMYGTASYIAKQAYEELKENRYPESLIHDCSVGPDWGTGSLGITTMMVDKDDTDLGVYQCQGAHMIDSVYMA